MSETQIEPATGLWLEGSTPPRPGVPLTLRPGIQLFLANNPSSWTFEGTNTWVLTDQGQAIVVDPGPVDEPHQQAVADWLAAREAHLEHLVISHGHWDHSGGAKPLAALTGSSGVTDLRGSADGTPLPFGGDSGEHLLVYRTPGHTSDGITLLWPRHKVAFVGDTALARVNPYIHHPDGTVTDILESMDKLAGLLDDSWLMLSGHGPVITSPRSHLVRRMTSRQRRIAEVRAHHEDGLVEEQIVNAMYGDRGEQTRRAAAATVQALLAHITERN
ncbi:MBL fold metallo-hydrolase [Ornithinimicrobium murale]|uniref:MBL fold metallo-hydrolase n=1 Tax=Ornithinimicrobium murale TaxID=1050153 RepID=UPI0013B457D2|nr:MBL fold metallo-hydrolase [Ornithinimicrobium murale]